MTAVPDPEMVKKYLADMPSKLVTVRTTIVSP